MLTRLPSGPSGSTIAGILLLGLIARKSGAICSPLVMLIGMTLYGSSISSSATLILRPFGVFQVCSSMVISVIPRERACEGIGGLRALMIHFAVRRGDSMTNKARFIRADRLQTRWDMIDLEALLPSDHRTRVVWDFVEGLDLSALYDAIEAREGEPGRPPPDPAALMALWLYAP